MTYKIEQLKVWRLAMEYTDLIYVIAEQLPRSEDFNLKSQMTRAATSVALNIAEGLTGQSNAGQARFLGIAIRSLIETVACQHLIRRRGYCTDDTPLRSAYDFSQKLFAKLSAFALDSHQARYARSQLITTLVFHHDAVMRCGRWSFVSGHLLRNASRNDLRTPTQ